MTNESAENKISLEDKYTLTKGANWVDLQGKFIPSELRRIANAVEDSYNEVPKRK